MTDRPGYRFPRLSAEAIGRLAVDAVFFISGLALTGWALSIDAFKSVSPHWASMRIVTIACFLMSALSLILLRKEALTRRSLVISRLFGAAVAATGIVTVVSYLVELATGAPWSWAFSPLLSPVLAPDFRMALITAIVFAIFGSVLLFFGVGSRRAADAGHVILLPMAILTYLVIVGYLFDIRPFYEWLSPAVALNTGIAFCALCIAALCTRRDTWLTRVFTGDDAGAIMARRLLPAILLIPLVIGWLRMEGERHGVFASDVGVALVAVTYAVCFLGLVWLNARSANRTDQRRRRAEDTVTRAKEQWERTFDSVPDLIAILDPQNHIVRANKAMAERLSCSSDACTGLRCYEHVHGTDAPPPFCPHAMTMADGRQHVAEVREESLGGYFLVSTTPLFDAEGGMVGTVHVARDITERKRAEEALRQSERRLNRAQEISHVGSWELDLASSRLTWSDEIYRIFGLRPQEFGATYEAFLDAVHPDDRAAVDAAYASSLREGRASYEIEHRVVRKSTGEVRWVRERCEHVRDDSDCIVRSVGMVQDITESRETEEALRQSEGRLRTILDALPVAVFLTDKAGNIIFTNTGVDRIWEYSAHVGRDRYGEYKGWWRSDGRPVEPDDWALSHTLETGEPFVNDPVEIEGRDGVRKIIHNLALPIRGESGELLGAVVVTENVTERVQAQEELRLSKEAAERTSEELARSNRDLEQFAYVASHDLQEPLRMVTGFMQLFEQKYKGHLDEQADQYIHYAVDGARRMQGLIDDLLAYSRVGRRTREPALTASGGALAVALGNLRGRIEESGARVTHGDLPTVCADGGQLAQLFQNLIGNAIKFRGDRPPEVRVDARRDDGEWVFSVKDNGIGIAPEFQDRIFLIFQRLHGKDKYPGTGIGLAICKRIVERHGGRIWVESMAGQGSTFHFTIPDKEQS